MATLAGLRPRVLAALRTVGPGEVVTYGELAREAGSPRQSRLVGRILAEGHPDVPWWRVVTATGRLVPGHEAEQRRRLVAEGVTLTDRGVRMGRGPARSPAPRPPRRRPRRRVRSDEEPDEPSDEQPDEEVDVADEDARPEAPPPSGITDWVGQQVTLHMTGAGRVKSLKGELVDLAGDGFVVAEEDAEWWVPRGMVQAVQRPHPEGG